jgi:hypothetical protein
MMMLNTAMGMATASVPDVCQTPAGPSLVPVPYPNIGQTTLAMGMVTNVLLGAMPALNLGSTIPLSNGDQAGVGMGVTSGQIMGEIAFTSGSKIVMVGGMPAVRMSDPTTQNARNTMGMAVSPGQQIAVDANG